jgi:DNA-binding transcriptional LysR family regulator
MHPNLFEQLSVFRAVTDHGTFSKAARALNRAVSSVSYTIASLEDQLQLSLFDRTAYRPTLTVAGKSLYDDADLLLRRVDRFASKVNLLGGGGKTSIVISVDALFPRTVLVEALAKFAAEYPEVSVSIRQRDWDTAIDDMKEGTSDLGLVRVDPRLSLRDIEGMQIGTTQNLLVASPDHPLAKSDEPFEFSDLDNYRQVFLSHTPISSEKEHYLIHRTDIWTVADEETLRDLVVKNVGWAYLNRHAIWQDLQDGKLVILKCKGIREYSHNRLAVAWLVSDPPFGPSLRLAELLKEMFPAAFPENFDEEFKQWNTKG